MVYAFAVGMLVMLAALAAEQGTRLARRAGRWVWALAMVLAVALPLLAIDGEQSRASHGLAPTWSLGGMPATPALSPRAWLPERLAGSTGKHHLEPTDKAIDVDVDIDLLARRGWQLSSALALAWLVAAVVALRRRQGSWRPGVFAGAAVLVSDDAGPAVVGVLRPRIVIPAWLFDATDGADGGTPACDRAALVLAHEQSHIAAGDQRLLAAMALLVAAMPWNAPLWFALRRLRRAIEIDCDARVLSRGYPPARYGAALVEVGAHRSHLPLHAAAMAHTAGFLEQRLRLMLRRPARWHRVAAPLLLLLSVDIGVAAARIVPPSAPTTLAQRAPASGRGALAGYYDLGANRVAVVTVSAEGLVMKTNLEPAWPLLPVGADEYAVAATDLRVRFDRAAGTLAVGLGGGASAFGEPAPCTAAGAVERADAWVAARVASGQPRAGGADIVRRNLGANSMGQLHAGDFTAGFLRQASALMPRQAKLNARAGAVREVRFAGVNRWGWDRYTVRYANTSMTWAIWLDADGRLANATAEAAPR